MTTMSNIDWTFCLIADADAAGKKGLVPLVEESIYAGATLIQLRAKSMPSRQMFDLALDLAFYLGPKHIPLIINDRIDIALACRADGVHLGQSDLPLIHARRIMGKQRIIGISAGTVPEAVAAETQGADYIGTGPVFPTTSKEDPGEILGLEGLRSIRESVRIPILAIGGINLQNAKEVMATGSDGIAVISAVLDSEDIYSATRRLLDIIKRKAKKNG